MTVTPVCHNGCVKTLKLDESTSERGEKVKVLSFPNAFILTLVLLNPDIPCFANSVDPDQLASEEAN